MKSKVYFSKTITPEEVLKLYDLLGVELTGNVAIKVHSGEPGNQNFLKPEFWKDVVDYVGGTIVECNTAYEGTRNTTERHRELLKYHGWSDMYPVDLLDAQGPDMVLEIPEGKKIKKNFYHFLNLHLLEKFFKQMNAKNPVPPTNNNAKTIYKIPIFSTPSVKYLFVS